MEQTTNETSIQSIQTKNNTKSKGMICAIIISVIFGLAGIAFGAYGMVQSNNKTSEISELKTNVNDKSAKIEELETTISNLNTKEEATVQESAIIVSESETQTKQDNETASIILGDVIDENETRTVYKIGDCSADGPSVKCSISTNNGEALISVVTTDSILRLTIPNN